jgi:hypothetical protein|tara:strand:+ start:1447 stop:1563 length:117 start_codon:yes stop_codon:yes gene_type:complete
MINWLKNLFKKKPKERARDKKGRFLKDNPKTKKNEAYD